MNKAKTEAKLFAANYNTLSKHVKPSPTASVDFAENLWKKV